MSNNNRLTRYLYTAELIYTEEFKTNTHKCLFTIVFRLRSKINIYKAEYICNAIFECCFPDNSTQMVERDFMLGSLSPLRCMGNMKKLSPRLGVEL